MSDATGLTNELFYRNGPTPSALLPTDAELVRNIIRKAELETIEECALLIEDYSEPCTPEELAAAIRALKDKP